VGDGSLTDLSVVPGELVKIFGWYYNEWAYTNRLLDLTGADMACPRRRV
jgi:glyceraldehyde-3-phosphate dehydrogenase/erythrose-4-phosphate dehydrogenase